MASREAPFSRKVRIRVCGLLIEADAILLVQLHSPVADKLIWTPPGGGLEFGETMEECLKREFVEETGLEIAAGELFHINELIQEPFHAVEFYFRVSKIGGRLSRGRDPELAGGRQMLRAVQWKPVKEIGRLSFAPESLAEKLRDRDGTH